MQHLGDPRRLFSRLAEQKRPKDIDGRLDKAAIGENTADADMPAIGSQDDEGMDRVLGFDLVGPPALRRFP